MPAPERPAVRVTDLRGTAPVVPEPVLADPSGRRAVLLHRVGRVVGTLFLVWFVCLVLAGLGLLPASGVPLAGSVAPRTQPRGLARIPAPRPTPAADLKPAQALSTRDGGSGATPGSPGSSSTSSGSNGSHRPSNSAKRRPKHLPASGTKPSAPATTVPLPTTTTPGNGHSTTTPGKSTTAPGHSTTKPGKGNQTTTATTTTTTTTPGRSGSAPGQTRTDTTGHGPPK